MDSHTSDICKSLDGKVFPISDYRVGVTAPPFHVNCRSTTAPHFEGDFAIDGSPISQNMSFEEWEKRFVNNGCLTNASEGGTIKKTHSNDTRPMAYGGRRERSYELTNENIELVKSEAEAIEIPTDVLRFNVGLQTGFLDKDVIINIRGDIFPDEMSTDNRDLPSIRAVLAHEYYGHYKSYPSKHPPGSWLDEFSASYNAALNAPNLSDEDRARLMIDAYERAKSSGISVKYNKKAREIIYGKQEND